MERLDSLAGNASTKLKFKPKAVRRSQPASAVATPTQQATRTNKQKPKPKPRAIKRDTSVASVGPLAQGAISLNTQQRAAHFGSSSSLVKREPVDGQHGDNGIIDIANPPDDPLFPVRPTKEDHTQEDISESDQLQNDYKLLDSLFFSPAVDFQGDVKMEEGTEPVNKDNTSYTFLQLPKLPIEAPEGLIGKINKHASGKISLNIGEINFDLCIGGKNNQLVWVIRENEVQMLGSIQNRIVATPNF